MFAPGCGFPLAGQGTAGKLKSRRRAKSAPTPAQRCNWANGGYSPRRFCAQNLPFIPGRRAFHAASEERCLLRPHLPKAACSAAIPPA